MKKLLFLALAVITMLSSCKKEVEAVPDFTYYESSATPGKVIFNDASSNATTWFWDFGDYGTSSERNPEHIYTENGTYAVKLNVTGNKTITKYITISSIPAAATTGQCVFWTGTNTYGQINIYVSGGAVGTITSYQTNGLAPNCGAGGSITVERPAGTYNFTASSTDGNWSWNGSFTIQNGVCSKKQLQ